MATTPTRSRPKWLVALLAVLALAVVGAGVAVAAKAFSGTSPAPAPTTPTRPSWVPAHADGPGYPSGLEESFDAKGADDGIALSVTLQAPRSTGLSGDVLIAFPPASDGACPTVSGAGLTPLTVTHDGVSTPCSYRMAADLSAGQAATTQIQVTGADPATLSAWLSSLVNATQAGLDEVSGTAFALQRVQDIRVDVGDVQLSGGPVPVPYAVTAVWPSGQTAASTVLLRNTTLDYQATDLLRSLTGGAGLAGVDVRACPQVLVTQTRTVAQQTASSCFLDVRIGDLDSGQVGFAISQQPS